MKTKKRTSLVVGACAVSIMAVLPAVSVSASTPQTLNVMVGNSEFEKGQFAYNEVQAFMKANPDIHVNLQYVNVNWNNAFSALAASKQLPDVFQPPAGGSLQQMLANHWVKSLNTKYFLANPNFPKGSFQPGVNMSGGQVYSFPYEFKGGVLMEYNKGLMKQAGLNPANPPKTWAQLYSMSKQIAKKVPGKFGLVWPLNGAIGYSYLMDFVTAMIPTTNAGGFNYKTGAYEDGSPQVRQAVEFMINMAKSGGLDPNSVNDSLAQTLGAFANGQDAFIPVGIWGPENQDLQYGGGKNYGVTSLPVPKAGEKPYSLVSPAGTSFWISSTTKHYQAALKFVDWFTTRQFFATQLNKGELLPPNALQLLKKGYKFPTPQLQEEAQTYSRTTIYAPNINASPGAALVNQILSLLPPLSPQQWQIVDGAVGGHDSQWQSQLQKVAVLRRQQLAQAIVKAQKTGAKVSLRDFQFPTWNGLSNYK